MISLIFNVLPRKFRVLHIPNNIQWAIGTIARRTADRNNSLMESTICSVQVYRELKVHRVVPDSFDLVHIQQEKTGFDLVDDFEGKIPVVSTTHHVEGERCRVPEPRFDAVSTASSQWYESLVEAGIDRAKLVQ